MTVKSVLSERVMYVAIYAVHSPFHLWSIGTFITVVFERTEGTVCESEKMTC